MSKGEKTFTEDQVTEFLSIVKEGWEPFQRDATNPHTKAVRRLVGKKAAVTMLEVTELMGVSMELARNIHKAAETRLRNAAKKALEARGMDPSAYKLWVDAGTPRGRGVSDPSAILAAAGISEDDLF